MKPITFNPKDGQAYQGDVVILPLPADLKISTRHEIPMRDGMLVLAEGEVTGHHHAIRYGLQAAARFHDGAMASSIISDQAVASARLYRDADAAAELVSRRILVTDTLCIGFLRIVGGCPPLTHDEHAAIKIPPGDYYVGAKREQDAAAERRVAD